MTDDARCSIDGCRRAFYAKGLCKTHYATDRRRKRGVEARPTSIAEREVQFWDRVDRSGDCWIWTRATSERTHATRGGYGRLSWNGRTERAHRVAYELAYGVHPGDLMVLHRCDNPPCCNPRHLFLGTAADNSEDMSSKGRSARLRGEEAGNGKLTEEDVLEIRRRRAEGEIFRTIAADFGIATETARQICAGERWRHVR